ncbi:photosystem I assembly protein Ycf3 [Prochlorothrix hollandica]|uniref:photosystem I assembly protein Ycf3 n=1 Tax=Prochlorothrix hollandica TaxID=1223 RepID=UPI003340EB11
MPRSQRNDNFVDKTFTVMADIILKILPTNKQAKEAFAYYRDGMSAQGDGEYAEALQNYEEALKLEPDPNDRSFILYNIGLIHTSNGDHDRAIDYYLKAVEQNPQMPQAFNNLAVIHHYRAEQLKDEEKQLRNQVDYDQGDGSEPTELMLSKAEALDTQAEELYTLAAEYWVRAIQLAPNNYIEAQNWLKTSGRSKIDVYF